MHDPQTVAFDIKIPKLWRKKKHGIRPSIYILTVWHVDPQKDGSDNSCDWNNLHFPKAWVEDMSHLSEDAQSAVRMIWWMFNQRLRPRAWWRHPKWHVHHWKLQWHLILQFKRWMWSRCKMCGGRFTWHDSGGHVIGSWGNKGPSWFKNTEDVWHMHCTDKTEHEAVICEWPDQPAYN